MIKVAGAIVFLAALTALLCLAYLLLRGHNARVKNPDSKKKTIPSATSAAALRG